RMFAWILWNRGDNNQLAPGKFTVSEYEIGRLDTDSTTCTKEWPVRVACGHMHFGATLDIREIAIAFDVEFSTQVPVLRAYANHSGFAAGTGHNPGQRFDFQNATDVNHVPSTAPNHAEVLTDLICSQLDNRDS